MSEPSEPAATTVWLPEAQRHAVGRAGRDPFRGSFWSAGRGEHGVLAACALAAGGGSDAAVLVQLAHRARPGTPLVLLRARGAGVDRMSEVRAEDLGSREWQRAVLLFSPLAAETVELSVEALGAGEVQVGAVTLWRRRGRPVWVISHMSNSPKLIREDLAGGANVVECDVGPRARSGKEELMVFHRFAPPYFRRTTARASLAEVLAEARGSLDRLSLVMFDCHVLRDGEDYRAHGRRLADAIGAMLPPERVLFSVPEVEMAPLFDGLRDAGFGAGRDLCLDGESPGRGQDRRWVDTAESLGTTTVGVGTDGFVPWHRLAGWFGPLAAAVNARDRGGSVAKVYYWTVSTKAAMRKLLDFAVDGVLVNEPRALREVLEEEPYKDLYRPAGPGDSQFRVHGPAGDPPK
jgi:hypothetical protein